MLDEYNTEENPIRVIDVFVNQVDLAQLGFEGIDSAQMGWPSYQPSVMLKIYIYGYLTAFNPADA